MGSSTLLVCAQFVEGVKKDFANQFNRLLANSLQFADLIKPICFTCTVQNWGRIFLPNPYPMQQRRSSTIMVPVRWHCPRGDSDFRENVKANGRQSKETFSTSTSRHEETIASHFAHLIFELPVQIPDVGGPTTRSVDSFCTTTQETEECNNDTFQLLSRCRIVSIVSVGEWRWVSYQVTTRFASLC
jgi:hypothetical protein